ncbi:MAG: polyprenol monophosphomannose synthase [Magnetococcus sp. DMHC-1]|nr:polyprenol monophosphomannose synthase [Magnetococcales bacterium]
MTTISMVLPTYNEAENIGPLVERLGKALAAVDYELIVVDDDSPDLTWQLAETIGQRDARVRVIRRQGERGLTSAINRGIEAARGTYVGWMDCDLAHPPELVSSLLQPLLEGQSDCVIASRFIPGGADTRSGQYELQRILSQFLSQFSGWLTRLPVKDITSGYLVLKRECFSHFKLEGDYGEYFIFMVHQLVHRGYRISEIPYTFGNRQFGESKTATNMWGFFRRGIKYLRMLYLCWTGIPGLPKRPR